LPPSVFDMSKICYSLYDKIFSPLKLWWAYKGAARGKRYTPAVASFEYDLEKNLIEIEHDLKNESYEMGGYHSFRIDKPKRRLVNAAPFRDRVVHHALMNVIEPLFERQFIFDSYANRNRNDPTNTNNNIGFRCSRLLPSISSTRMRHVQGCAASVVDVSAGDSCP
jgi:hypothetical protein